MKESRSRMKSTGTLIQPHPKNSTIVRSIENTLSGVELSLLPKTFALGSLFAPALAAALAEKYFLTPARFEAPEHEKKFMETGHSFKIPFRDGQLAAWSWGDGPTVVLFHGWSGRAGQMYSFVTPLVEAGYSVIAFDAPAHGQSDGEQASIFDFKAALNTVVNRVWPVHSVIGHSMGGCATTLALHEGLNIDRVVVVASPCSPESYSEIFAKRMGISDGVLKRIRKNLEKRYGKTWEQIDLSLISRDLKKTRALLVYDENDPEVPYENAAYINEAWPESEVFTTTGLGHRKILRSAEVIQRAIAFIGSPSGASDASSKRD